LYQHQSTPLQIAALALLALVLGAVRTMAIIYSPMEKNMVESFTDRKTSAGEPAADQAKIKASAAAVSPVH
jgi:hypothetical protein